MWTASTVLPVLSIPEHKHHLGDFLADFLGHFPFGTLFDPDSIAFEAVYAGPAGILFNLTLE